MIPESEGSPSFELNKANSVYVFSDHAIDDAKIREIEGRRYIWVVTLEYCVNMLYSSIRAAKWRDEAKKKKYEADNAYFEWRKMQPNYRLDEPFDEVLWREYRLDHIDDFPTVLESFNMADGLAQIRVITFLTVFNNGWPDDGVVAANISPAVNGFRQKCLLLAIPEARDRSDFDALLIRLKSVRDGLIAHKDGAVHEMDHQENIVTFKSPYNLISREDVASLYSYARSLFDVVRTTDAI